MKKDNKRYAVIRINGNQYRVGEEEEILVDKIKDTQKIAVEVMLFTDGEKVLVGKPILKDVKVSIKVLEDIEKGEKIHVRKFRAKSRYRKHIGFRPQYTRLLVEKISK